MCDGLGPNRNPGRHGCRSVPNVSTVVCNRKTDSSFDDSVIQNRREITYLRSGPSNRILTVRNLWGCQDGVFTVSGVSGGTRHPTVCRLDLTGRTSEDTNTVPTPVGGGGGTSLTDRPGRPSPSVSVPSGPGSTRTTSGHSFSSPVSWSESPVPLVRLDPESFVRYRRRVPPTAPEWESISFYNVYFHCIVWVGTSLARASTRARTMRTTSANSSGAAFCETGRTNERRTLGPSPSTSHPPPRGHWGG